MTININVIDVTVDVVKWDVTRKCNINVFNLANVSSKF